MPGNVASRHANRRASATRASRCRAPDAADPLLALSQCRRRSAAPPPDLDAVGRARDDAPSRCRASALAIVKDDGVVVAKGYGVRKLGEPAPVDARTLFGIASNTKAFTATALGPAGRGGQDRMGRAGRALSAGVRDVGSVRHARADGARPARAPQRPRARRRRSAVVAASRPTTARRSRAGCGSSRRRRSFRTAYAYDNVLYLVAGELIETISGQIWEDFVADAHPREGRDDRQQRAAFRRGGAAATSPAPHARVDGRVRPIAPFESDNTNPAGGINSSAEDMAKWMRVQLSGGKLADGSRLFSAATARQLTTHRHADPDRRSAAGAARRCKANFRRLRARASTSATTAATSS